MSLSKTQVRALDAMLQTATVADAARLAGLSERTMWRYLRDTEFAATLRQRQDEVIQVTTTALVGLSGKAVQVLSALLEDPDAPIHVKARVAMDVLKQVRDTKELDDVLARLTELEKGREQ